MRATGMFRNLVSGLIIGAAGMYLFDPARGRRRRAIFFDKINSYGRVLMRNAERKSRHLSNKAKGVAHEVRKNLNPDSSYHAH